MLASIRTVAWPNAQFFSSADPNTAPPSIAAGRSRSPPPRVARRSAPVAMAATISDASIGKLAENTRAVLDVLPEDPLMLQIQRMKEEQARVRAEKKAISKSIRNATKKAQRLRKRARLMTDDDLVAVLFQRKTAASKQAEQQAKEDEPDAISSAATKTGTVDEPAAIMTRPLSTACHNGTHGEGEPDAPIRDGARDSEDE